jgi:hypothetical protein
MEFGSYSTVRQISRAGEAAVHEVRPTSDTAGERRCAKSFEAPIFWREAHTQRRLAVFKSRIEIHQRVLKSGHARHWAPLHEVELNATRPYYITHLYRLSAEQLTAPIASPISAEGLYRIVSGTVDGLI